jgi:hypothetical protein
LRNGQPFGQHTVTVSRAGDQLRVRTRAALSVRAGPLTLFHYEQSCDETWQAGQLAGLSCSTLRDGRRTQVRAARAGEQLRVSGAEGEVTFPLGALPTSWWTKPPTNVSSMINTENGTRLPIRVIDLGREMFETNGGRISADHIRVQGSLTVDLWYDESGRWVGCAFSSHGQRITYRLTTPRADAPA